MGRQGHHGDNNVTRAVQVGDASLSHAVGAVLESAPDALGDVMTISHEVGRNASSSLNADGTHPDKAISSRQGRFLVRSAEVHVHRESAPDILNPPRRPKTTQDRR